MGELYSFVLFNRILTFQAQVNTTLYLVIL